ncbi:MAG: hypothetical protein IPN97_14010 [Saprospiraceae bacterium]|nr:hypothetical protein [Saprospiraceae bacterium]
MITIVESGSTKTEWAFVEGENILFFSTGGINPSTQVVVKEVLSSEEVKKNLKLSDTIYFYGAGIKTETNKKFIQDILKEWGCHETIHVMSDLLGACRACCKNKEGLVGILGTGSNFCFYDGQNIHQQSPSLGYILGDEGSGFFIGKKVIQSYFYDEMPSVLKSLFESLYTPNLDNILENTYKKQGNNTFIASFSGFLDHTDESYTHSIVRPLFQEYFEKKILPYKNQVHVPLHFVGSVAFHFQDILRDILKENGWKVDSIIEKPLQHLIRFHSGYSV